MKKSLTLLLFVGNIYLAFGQSCCSGGLCLGASSNDYIVNGLQSMIAVRYTTTANSFYLKSIISEANDIAYKDYFQQLNFSGRWNIKDRVALTVDLPFAFNHRITQERNFYTGLGDITLGAIGQLPTITHKNTKHKFFVGFSFQAPTGVFNKAVDTAGFSPLIQPGIGAWVVSPNIEYIFVSKDFSLSTGMTYRYALSNQDQLQIGGRLITWMRAAYSKKVFENRYIPSLGVIYEYLQKSKFKESPVSLSGGQVLSLEPALDIRIKKNWGFACKYRQPIFQELSKGYLKQYGTGTVQFNYFF